jgi:hypothetical protein
VEIVKENSVRAPIKLLAKAGEDAVKVFKKGVLS